MGKPKIIKIGFRKYKELCHYVREEWREDYYYPNYLGTWKLHSKRLTNNPDCPKDRPHIKFKVKKLAKPKWKEFLTL